MHAAIVATESEHRTLAAKEEQLLPLIAELRNKVGAALNGDKVRALFICYRCNAHKMIVAKRDILHPA